MLVWGGFDGGYLDDGGEYILGAAIDGDGDGADDEVDCAPADGGVFAEPIEVEGFGFLADRITLSWDDLRPAVGTDSTYDLFREDLDDVGTTATGSEVCLASALSVTTSQDPSVPAGGRGYYYLVRATNACGVGSWGRTSADVERVAEACP
jgi:hypothetical protein